MKSRDSVLRLAKFQVREKTRQVTQIETMMGEFTRMAADLDAQIAYEEKKSGNSDPTHFAYSTFAKAARTRRENLEASVADLRAQMDAAEAALEVAEAELAKVERVEAREGRVVEEAPAPKRLGMIG